MLSDNSAAINNEQIFTEWTPGGSFVFAKISKRIEVWLVRERFAHR
jgi:hypothetical protein